jgi:diadenosine tetraphosphatase ApaH/serine/threonine PP2A family protein phosphatase
VWSICPGADASDEELTGVFGRLHSRRVVYGHLHRSFSRRVRDVLIANAGCLSLSYDGDPRATYALVDGDSIEIRHVVYDVEREARALIDSGFPYGGWMAQMLRKGSHVPPPAGLAPHSGV